jgi:hypothetical protein
MVVNVVLFYLPTFTTLLTFRTLSTKPQKKTLQIGQRFLFLQTSTVDVAQLVRASVCGTEGRGFEPHHLPIFFRLSSN